MTGSESFFLFFGQRKRLSLCLVTCKAHPDLSGQIKETLERLYEEYLCQGTVPEYAQFC